MRRIRDLKAASTAINVTKKRLKHSVYGYILLSCVFITQSQ